MKDETIKELIKKLEELRIQTFEHNIGIHSSDFDRLASSIYSLSTSVEKLEYRLEGLTDQMRKKL
jgi:chaperonin cofactor prefoldin